jgi:Trk-type K+ transport system membrane component
MRYCPNQQSHIRAQLAYDLWWLLLSIFLICIVERPGLATHAPGFSIFSVIFEVVSAYGTVGLSLGVPYDNYSFSGAWHTLSKLILIAVMLRGRHRILPAAVDRAVLVPGQGLMERLDRELAAVRTGRAEVVLNEKDKERIREVERGGQVEEGEGRVDTE